MQNKFIAESLESRRLFNAGTLDPTFNQTGVNTTDFGQQFDTVNGEALQSDGKVLVVGSSSSNSDGSTRLAFARYNADGTLDAGFGSDGVVFVQITGTTNNVGVGIAQLTTGKIIIAGSATVNGTQRYFTARYTAEGTSDSTYGSGAVSLAGPTGNSASAFLLGASDSVFIGGSSGSSFVVTKFDSTGAVDGSFGGSGVVTTAISDSAAVSSLALDVTNGDVIAAGFAQATGGDSNFAVARYTAAGVLDTTFGTAGIFTTDFAGTHQNDEALGVAVQPDEKIVLAGFTGDTLPKNGASRYAVLRLNADGTLDSTFASQGKYTSAPDGPRFQLLNAVTVLTNGDILAVGTSGDPTAPAASADAINSDMSALRLTPAGAEDSTNFGTAHGEATVDFNGQYDEAKAVLALADGRLVLAGNVGNVSNAGGGRDFGVARLANDEVVTFNATLFDAADVAQGQNAVFTVTVDHAPTSDLTFTYSTANGTALAGTDYTATVGGTVTILAGTTTATISVPTRISNENTTGRSFSITLTAPGNVTLTDATATATVVGTGIVPQTVVSISSVTVAEPATGATANAVFNVLLSSPSTSPVTVTYTTSNVAATAGLDYTATSGTIVIPAGQLGATVSVPVLADFLAEPNESFLVTLSNPSANAVLSESASIGIGTITDTLDAAPGSTISNATGNEPANGTSTSADFTVTLAHPHGADVTFTYSTADGTGIAGTDYTGVTSGTLVIPAGQTTGTISIALLHNEAGTTNTTFTVTVTAVDQATLPTTPTATATITNFVTPVVSVGNVSIVEPDPDHTNTAIFTVSLDHASTAPVTIAYGTADGTGVAGADYTATSGTLTIPAGQTSATISVTILANSASTADSNFTLTISAPTNATLGTAVGTASITNTSVNAPALPVATIGNATVAEPPVGGTRTVTFTVTLDHASTTDVTVDYATVDGTATAGSDYTAASGTLTIAAGALTGTITISVLPDTLVEAAETFTVVLGNASGAIVPTGTVGTGTITDTPVTVVLPVLSVADTTVTERLSDRNTVTFTVTLSSAYTEAVTFSYATADGTATAGSDYVATSGTITIPAGQTTATVTVIVKGDVTTESAETFSLALSNPTNATVSATPGTATITDATFTTIAFTGSSKTKTTYTDASGATVQVALSGPGSGVIYFPTGAGNHNADSIVLTGTTTKSKLTVTTAKNAFTTVSSIQSAAGLGTITAKGVNLAGDLAVAGALTGVTLAAVNGTGIPLNAIFTIGAGAATGVTLAAVTDASMTFGQAPKTLSVASWNDTGGDADVVTAPSFATVKSNGNFNAKLTATAGGITSLNAKGAITGGGVSVTGTIKGITAAAISNATVSSGADLSVSTKGAVGSSTFTSGTLIKKFGAASLTGSSLLAGTDVTSAAVKGAITSTTIRAGGNVKAVTATQLISSKILAGVATTTSTLPADAAAFAGVSATAAITKVSLSAKGATAFSNSLIIAPNVGSISLGTVAVNSGASSVTQGVATNILKSATFTPSTTGKASKLANLQNGGETDGDFSVRVF